MTSPSIFGAWRNGNEPKSYDFYTFAQRGSFITASGVFRQNITDFLQEYGVRDANGVQHMSTWCIVLTENSATENSTIVVPLYVIEEEINQSMPLPYCNHCQYAGWGNHLLCKRKYHFIIQKDTVWKKTLEFGVDDGFFDVKNHLLHGLVHANGFGHLLSINGIEGGSRFLYGQHIMDLWDRICDTLQVREISVVDSSTKRSMELRVLHGIAHGTSWFSNWEYKLYQGSFGVTEFDCTEAIARLSQKTLDEVINKFHGKCECEEIKRIIRVYRDLSETQLYTVQDLLKFMLTRNPPSMPKLQEMRIDKPPRKYRKFSTAIASEQRKWEDSQLEEAAETIVHVLKANNNRMRREKLEKLVAVHIPKMDLIRWVLKNLKDVVVGMSIVHRAANSEYTLHDLCVPYQDLSFFYTHVLLGEYSDDVTKVIRGKHFVKQWQLENQEGHLSLECVLQMEDLERVPNQIFLGEIVLVKLNSTVGDLRVAANIAFRETYCIPDSFLIEEIETLEDMEDGDQLPYHALIYGQQMFVHGLGVNLTSQFKYASPAYNLRCVCSARHNDGEKMFTCNVCFRGQHTLCHGYGDEVVDFPETLVCSRCFSTD